MGGSPQKAPQAYMPPNQAGAAAGFIGNTQMLGNAGAGLAQTVDQPFDQIATNVNNNPNYTSAMAGLQNMANLATGTVVPQDLAAANQIGGLGSTAGGMAQPMMNAAVGQGVQGQQTLNSYVPITSNPELMAGLQVLNTGFDPQQDLYNQNYQQMLDQNNAINAMSGVAGTPYGAGVTSDAARKFNTDWQNQQLSRQLQALGGYDSAASTAAGNVANLVGTGSNVFNAGINTGTGAFSTLTGDAINSANAASGLNTTALSTMAQAAQMPYDLSLKQDQAGLAALMAQVQGTNQSFGLIDQANADLMSYLGLGQNAVSVNQNAVAMNNQTQANEAAGFGQLFGDAASMIMFS